MQTINPVLEKLKSEKDMLSDDFPLFERPTETVNDPKTNEYHMSLILDHVANGQISYPIVIDKAEGVHLWDVTGKKYLDFMSSFGAANQGHNHPRIIEACIEQVKKNAITSRVTPHSLLGPASERLSQILGYDKILFMNSGAEAVDAAILTARRWAYNIKKIRDGDASILFSKNGYWGMTLEARAGTDRPSFKTKAEPLASKELHFDFVDFDKPDELEAKFKADSTICAYFFEPIQGEFGNIYPSQGYYKKVRDLCSKYKVLMVADEVQSGMGRTGKLFACGWENVRPDMVIMGKSLGGDIMPVSAVLADNEIMDTWTPGSHKSTYAASTMACAIAIASIDVLMDQKMIENSEAMGKIVEEEFKSLKYPFIVAKNYGKGLYASLQFENLMTCLTICQYMVERGVFVKPSPGGYLKVMPPLCIKSQELREGLKVLKEACEDFARKGKTSQSI